MMGIIGLIVFLADLWAILAILESNYTVTAKVIWGLLVLALPVVGLLAWFVAGPKALNERS